MIYRFTGIPESNEVNFTIEGNVVAYCTKGQILVDIKSDYKNCEITEIAGDRIETESKYAGMYFIPVNDTEEFIRTREYDFEMLGKKEPDYVEKSILKRLEDNKRIILEEIPIEIGNTVEERILNQFKYVENKFNELKHENNNI
jgi:hypothetical protein